MLQLEHIRKSYETAGFTQVALDDVSLAFRDSEFVAILGASGSGKTTMLNILGGLDHADSGDIVINGTSTRDYADKDWDTYRNHRIGFIFQSYNLIPHQTILSNVELALTLAGVPRAERAARAKVALERVGLGEHVNKRPNQLSGGQMQRVAIARALVNDPDIVLADEPTGALDTETGIQVMDLLQEIAQERLVIMVTHNPELAEQYATRIVRLSDGKIIDDTKPLQGETSPDNGDAIANETLAASTPASTAPGRAASEGEGLEGGAGDASAEARATLPAGDFAQRASEASAEPEGRAVRASADASPNRRTSMSFLTALALSLSNLMTKKGRTFMTAFAGSIGIIGIAAILALSNGVNSYIATTEQEALSSYPLTITKSSFDLTNLMVASMGVGQGDDADAAEPAGTIHQSSIMADMFAKVKNNDLRTFGAFLKSDESGIEPYVSSIQYTWGLSPLVYKADTSEGVSRLNPSRMGQTLTNGLSGSAFLGGSSMSSFTELLDDRSILAQSLEVVEGRWPEAYDECVLVLGRDGGLTDYTLYSLGFYDTKVMDDMTTKALNGEEVDVPDTYRPFTMEDAMALHFSVVPANRLYQRNAEQGTWTDMTGDGAYMRQAIAEGIDLHVVGVVKRTEDASSSGVPEGIGYTSALTLRLMEEAAASDIVREQRDNPGVDVFTGKTFDELREEGNRAFDMGSVISVDEEALSRAFSFDTGALSSLGQGMDLSGLDLSGLASMDMGGMDGLDLGDLDLSGLPAVATSVFTEDALRSLVSGAPRFALADPTITDEQAAAIDEASTRLTSGFIAWMVAEGHMAAGEEIDFATYFPQYLATDEAQAILADLAASEALDPESAAEVMEQVSEQLPAYMTGTLGPYFQAAFEQLLNQAAAAVMAEVASQLTAQMSALRNQMAGATSQLGQQLSEAISGQLTSQMSQLSSALSGGFSFDASAFSGAIQFNMTQEDLASLLTNFMNADELTYEGNLSKLGYAEPDSPDSISIYPLDFEAKESVLGIIDGYNDRMLAAGDDDSTIQYSDFAGVLMGSVTDIVNTVSLVLIAFVSISLVVSSIMISIITYISVLERKKEIGILRAMGASKLNIANIFNAETVIEGFIAGVLAIAVVYAASVPVNALILETRGVPRIMQLPWQSALALVGVSVGLTLVAGLIPSSAASRRDPVEALRSE